MKLQGFIQASLLLGAFVVGCSGAVSPPTASESESLSASKTKKDAGACVSQEDGPCGGFTEENGSTGFNCHNPALACASSLTCGGGCDFQVTGRCPS